MSALEQRIFELFRVESEVFNSVPHKSFGGFLGRGLVHSHIDVTLNNALELVVVSFRAISIQFENLHHLRDQVLTHSREAVLNKYLHCRDAEGTHFLIFQVETIQKLEDSL